MSRTDNLTREAVQMANKQRRRCSTSVGHQGKEIKTTVRYHYTPTECPKFQTLTTPTIGGDVEQLEVSFIVDGMSNGTDHRHCVRQCGSFFQK